MSFLRLIAAALWSLALLAPRAAPAGDQPPAPSALPPVTDLLERLAREPLPVHETLRITRLTEDAELSALLVQVRGTLPLHLHRRTREVLYLIQGEGLFRLGDAVFAIHPGSVVRVDPGQAHTFSVGGAAPAVFFVVTTPRWDETDRVMLDHDVSPPK